MNKNQKIALSVVAVLVVIYLVSVFIGLSQLQSSDRKGNREYGWGNTLYRAMSYFAPRVELSKLHCGSQSIKSYFELNEKNPKCNILLDAGLVSDEDFWKTDIVLSAQNTTKPDLYFLAKYSRDALKKSQPDEKCLNVDAKDVPSNFWLSIEMTPNDEGSIEKRCWLKSKPKSVIGLTVTGKSVLKIACHGCSDENKKRLTLRFKP